MKDLRSKKAIAASLSLTLALGSVPAVALADDADENSEGATSEQPAAQGQNLEVIAFFQGGARNGSETILTAEGVSPKDSVAQYVHDQDGYTLQAMSANAATGPELYMTSSLEGVTSIYVYYMAKDQAEQQPEAKSLNVVSFFQGGERDGSTEENTVNIAADSSVADCVKSYDGYTPQSVSANNLTGPEVNMTSSLEGITSLYVIYKADKQAEQQPEVETQDLKVIGFFRGGALDGGSHKRRGGFEAHAHEHDLAVGIVLGERQRVERGVDDPDIAARRLLRKQAGGGAGNARHVAEGGDRHLGDARERDDRVDVVVGRDAHRTARARRQLDALGHERADAVARDGDRMGAAHLHQRGALGGRELLDGVDEAACELGILERRQLGFHRGGIDAHRAASAPTGCAASTGWGTSSPASSGNCMMRSIVSWA